MKVLIIRLEHETEILFTTPVVRAIRNTYPTAKIHYLVKKESAQHIIHCKYLDKVYAFEGDLRDTVLELLQEKYDVIVDLQKNFRSANVTAMLTQAFNSEVSVFKVNKMSIRKWILRNFGINLLPDLHEVDRYFRAVRKFKIANDGQGLDFQIPDEELIKNEDLPMSHSAGYISFVIDTTSNGLSVDQWITVCKNVDYPIILQGGEQYKDKAAEIAQLDPIRIYNSCGKFTFNEHVDIIRYAKVVVGESSFLIHAAAAFKRRIVSVILKHKAEAGFYPYHGYNNLKGTISPDLQLFTIKSNRNLSKQISVEALVDAVKKYLKK